ncbi:MAG: AMP-binding protein [Roseibium sp.]|nr:AMP-binding protein [Roseibium sp.]
MDLSAWIEKHADFTPEKPALIYQGEEISYADFARRIHHRAAELKTRFGIGRGDRVTYLGLNSPEFLVLFFACARLGALFLPLNWRLAAAEHAFILRDAQVRMLVCEAEFQTHAQTVRASLPECDFVAADFDADGWDRLRDPDSAETGASRNPHVDLMTPLLLVYTSGTTGYPKGAVLTQEAIQWNAFNSLHMHDMTSRDRILTVLPMFHVGGLNIQTTPALYAGATVILHRKFDPAAALQALEQDGPSLTVLVPATISALVGQPGWPDVSLPDLRAMTTGSSSVPHTMIEAFHKKNVPVLQVYGATETCPIAIYLRADDAEAHIGSTGKPALHCDIRITAEDGKDAGSGVPGEILVRGPNVMFEYWGNATATTAALQDGWFHTGDIGYRDGEGYYYINDRKKDVIISGGENIYPAELELVLSEIEEIAEAVVVGRRDAQWGHVPVAVAVKGKGQKIDAADVLDRFNGRIARFKHPKDVVFVDSLPVNAMGKVQKFAVRELIDKTSSGPSNAI